MATTAHDDRRRKITLIGAGSASFSQSLLADLIRSNTGRRWHVALVDIDQQALDTTTRLTEKMVDATGADIELSSAGDRREVLPGSHYVVSTIGVGGRRAWQRDVAISRAHGVFQPVGDSVMPGGISRAMRMIPVSVALAQDVAALCPTARLFNFANPMTVICRAIRRETGVEVVGLCHGVHHTVRTLAAYARRPPAEVTAYAVGLNHCTFIYELRHRDTDLFPELRARYARDTAGGIDTERLGIMFAEAAAAVGTEAVAEPGADARAVGDPYCWELFAALGVYPAPGDRHVCEFFPERFGENGYYGKTLGVDAYSLERVIERGDNTYEKMRQLAADPGPLPPSYFDRHIGEHEQLLEIIDVIECDGRRVYSVNVPNDGAVDGFPSTAVLEMPALATSRGLLPLCVRDFPVPAAALLARHIAAAEVTVEAALRGDPALMGEAIQIGGAVPHAESARRLADELIAGQREHLPQFA